MRSRLAASTLLAALGGCTVGPRFHAPSPATPAAWNDVSAHVTQHADSAPDWWSQFDDPVLTQLEKQAISGNLDLRQAVLRVVQARQNEISARAGGLPSLSGTASYTRQQLGAKGLLESQGVAPTGMLAAVTQPADLYQYGLNASWELDLFGRVRRSAEQARASTQAQAEAANDSLVMLEGQVASAYVQVRGAQALLASETENVATARSALDLTRRQQAQGLATQLDVDQAATLLSTTEARLPGYQKQQLQTINTLAVLVGQAPGALDAMLAAPAAMPTIPDLIGVGLPSDLARRRPDIREAEAQLHSATANVGVATASFYPDISLTGEAGLRALNASYLTNWASLFYSFSPSISLPIFQGGRLTANLRLARAQQAAAALAYRGAVLNALKEVENALVAYRTDRSARDRLRATIGSGEEALLLARDSYRNGLTSFLQVLDVERTLVQSRQQLIQAEITLTGDVIALYGALGGGWRQTQAEIPPPEIDMSTPFAPAAIDRIAATKPTGG